MGYALVGPDWRIGFFDLFCAGWLMAVAAGGDAVKPPGLIGACHSLTFGPQTIGDGSR